MNYLGSSNYKHWPYLQPQAPTAEAITFTIEADGPLSSSRVLAITGAGLVLADKDTLTHQDKIVGFTISSAANAGEMVDVISEGYNVDPSYTFTPGPFWLDNGGTLTQVKPTTGVLIQLGVALSATEIIFDIGLAIKLA